MQYNKKRQKEIKIERNSFSDGAKIASARPTYSRHQVENYRPVSMVNVFSKICEKYIDNSLIPFADNFLSVSISAYRQICS